MALDPAASLAVEISSRPGADVITLRGVLDLHTSIALRSKIYEPQHWTQTVVVIDLNGLNFMDSAGLGSLVAAQRWMRFRGMTTVLACSGGQPLKVSKAVRLDIVFDIVSHPDDLSLEP